MKWTDKKLETLASHINHGRTHKDIYDLMGLTRGQIDYGKKLLKRAKPKKKTTGTRSSMVTKPEKKWWEFWK